MKILTLILVTVFVACTNLASQQGARWVTQKQGKVLFDFRVDRPNRVIRIAPATQRQVLSKVFPKFLTDESDCSDFDAGSSEDYLDAARKAGQMVPAIVDVAQGSFTAQGQQQTAYVVSVGECGASHADNFGSKRLAIFSGQRLLAQMDVDFKQGILRKTDLNGDGLNELLMTGGDMNQGIVVETAALLDFENGQLRVIKDFGQVSENSCASGLPGSGITASVISIEAATAGKMPNLRIDNYGANCRRVRRWRFVSTGKMQS